MNKEDIEDWQDVSDQIVQVLDQIWTQRFGDKWVDGQAFVGNYERHVTISKWSYEDGDDRIAYGRVRMSLWSSYVALDRL